METIFFSFVKNRGSTSGAATNNYRVVSVTPTMVGYSEKKKKKKKKKSSQIDGPTTKLDGGPVTEKKKKKRKRERERE